MKNFNLGFFLGRFQHIHKGHEELINFGLDNCTRLCILISSSQRSRSSYNPFNIKERQELISKIYYDEIEKRKIILHPIEDFLDDEEKSKNWNKYIGKQVYKSVLDSCGENPDLFIYGNDDLKKRCYFTDDERNKLSEFIVSRNHLQKFSATKVREHLINNNKEEWIKCVNTKILGYYDYLRDILLQCNRV